MSSATIRRIMSGEAEGLAPSVARGGLRALSYLYAGGSSLREFVATGQGGAVVDAPVLSVGNLTVGGTGKTPFVSLVVGELVARGRRPVILSRGYAADESGTNDEFDVLRHAHPDVMHLQGKDRVALAQDAVRARLGDVLVLDDGFQYHALHRDLNVCLIDATNPFGYDAVLPRGLLREPPSGLYRARPVVITRSELVTPDELAAVKAQIEGHNELARVIVSAMRFTNLLSVGDDDLAVAGKASELDGRKVLLASGIGNPVAFARGVRIAGARVVAHEERGDHHAWTAEESLALARRADELGADLVLTTVKDAVKLAGGAAWPADLPPLRAVEVEVEITEGADLWSKLLDELLAGR